MSIQLRIDGVKGYGLPLDPVVLAELDPFEVARICMYVNLDDEQESCVEEAVAAVRSDRYPERSR